MLELREQAEAKGIRFELRNPTKWVRRVRAVSRLDAVFRITSALNSPQKFRVPTRAFDGASRA